MSDIGLAGGGATGALVGRTDDLARLHSFLAESRTAGRTLLLSGGAGLGKTVLLDAAAGSAASAGMLVLRAGGVEFEADVSFSALNQLLQPLRDTFDQVSEIHRDALSVALGFDEGPGGDRGLVAEAALALLERAAAVRPLLMVVDDLHWVDRSSASVLTHLAANLGERPIGFLGAFRSEEDMLFDRAELPVHHLRPLDERAAAGLVGTRFPMLAARVAQRVLAEAQGNPLALVELPSALTGSQRSAREDLPAVLPLSRRLHDIFAARIAELPGATRDLLLLAALDGSGDLGRLSPPTFDGPGLVPAARAGLVTLHADGRHFAFRHPLIRSTVVTLASGVERRAAHRQLAARLEISSERRAWHLAEASVGPDEQVAGLLERTAYRTLRRGDAAGAVTALLRSADLSPSRTDRSRRLAEAAYVGADVTGELRNASGLLLAARRADPQSDGSLRAAVAAAYVLLNDDGDVDTAHRLLVGAIESRAEDSGTGDSAFVEALQTLLFVCVWAKRPEFWAPFRAATARLEPGRAPILELQTQVLSDPAHASATALARLDEAVASLDDETDPTRIGRIAQAATYVDRLPACRRALWRIVQDGRDGGAVAAGLNALIQLCFDAWLSGRWEKTEQLAGEGLELCAAHGYGLPAWPFRLAQALVAAARGNFASAESAAERMSRWAAPRGIHSVQLFAHHVRTLVALGRGDAEEAFRQVSSISPAGTFPEDVAHAVWVPMYLVEAALRTNRPEDAAAHVRAMQELDLAAVSPRLSLVVAGSAAMATPGPGSLDLFERALTLPDADRWPFDLARIQLAYGERLRRSRSTSRSRIQLSAALDTFEGLGARPWALRARSELRATGSTTRRHDGHHRGHHERPGAVRLTPREREVALLAAAGLSNRQIAERLLLSHRTVGAHLRQVFPKLGVSSRAALRDALGARPAAPGGAAVARATGSP